MRTNYPHTYLIFTKVISGIAIALCLQGCVPLIFGAAITTTSVVVTDRRTAGTLLEDQTIGSKVAYRIDSAYGEKVHVNANAYNSRVLLTGEVPNTEVQNSITRIASEVENVKTVFNHTIVAPLSDFGARSYDNYLYTKVLSTFVTTYEISSGAYSIIVEGNVVYLMGKVTMQEGRVAAQVAAGVSGVERVVTLFEYITEEDLKK